jgi:hypothetical protein
MLRGRLVIVVSMTCHKEVLRRKRSKFLGYRNRGSKKELVCHRKGQLYKIRQNLRGRRSAGIHQAPGVWQMGSIGSA